MEVLLSLVMCCQSKQVIFKMAISGEYSRWDRINHQSKFSLIFQHMAKHCHAAKSLYVPAHIIAIFPSMLSSDAFVVVNDLEQWFHLV